MPKAFGPINLNYDIGQKSNLWPGVRVGEKSGTSGTIYEVLLQSLRLKVRFRCHVRFALLTPPVADTVGSREPGGQIEMESDSAKKMLRLERMERSWMKQKNGYIICGNGWTESK